MTSLHSLGQGTLVLWAPPPFSPVLTSSRPPGLPSPLHWIGAVSPLVLSRTNSATSTGRAESPGYEYEYKYEYEYDADTQTQTQALTAAADLSGGFTINAVFLAHLRDTPPLVPFMAEVGESPDMLEDGREVARVDGDVKMAERDPERPLENGLEEKEEVGYGDADANADAVQDAPSPAVDTMDVEEPEPEHEPQPERQQQPQLQPQPDSDSDSESSSEDDWPACRKPVGRFVLPPKDAAIPSGSASVTPLGSSPSLAHSLAPAPCPAPAQAPAAVLWQPPRPFVPAAPQPFAPLAAARLPPLPEARISQLPETESEDEPEIEIEAPELVADKEEGRSPEPEDEHEEDANSSLDIDFSPSPEPETRRNTIPKRQVTLQRKPIPAADPPFNPTPHSSSPPDPYDEQWRVGKMPGHQGSHVRSKRRADAEDKYDSTKVLKRPFHPPTRLAPVSVNVTKVRHVSARSPPAMLPIASSSSEMNSSPPSKSSSSSTSSPSTASLSTLSTPASSSSRTSARAAKPFRPLTRSSAPSPSSLPSRTRTTSIGKLRLSTIDPDADLLAALEARARTLRQAIKYTSSEDEDARLARLVVVWREAGREVADRLFQLLPEPVEEQAPRGSGGSWGWGWDEADETVQPLSSAEVKEFLALPTNAKGETCDEDGVPLFSDDGDDLASIIEQACARGKRAGASGSGSGSRSGGLGLGLELVGFGEADVPPANTQPAVWDRGTMLVRLGVDPALLGWDADADDWEEIDDEDE